MQEQASISGTDIVARYNDRVGIWSLYIGGKSRGAVSYDPSTGQFYCVSVRMTGSLEEIALAIEPTLAPVPRRVWSVDEIVDILRTKRGAVRRALSRLIDRTSERDGDRDGIGLNRYDRKTAKQLLWAIARIGLWTPRQSRKAYDIALKYRKQLTDIANGDNR